MYKLLLCLRYLRTRYIALASIVSVTLGVATMIVVNSVMEGFQKEMYIRLHDILSDIVVESHGLDGIGNPPAVQDEIRRLLGDDLIGMTATVHVPALLSFRMGGQSHTRPVTLIGIDQATYTQVGDFGKYLLHPANRQKLSFALRESGYDARLPHESGQTYRRENLRYQRAMDEARRRMDQIRQDPNANLAENPRPAADDDLENEAGAPGDPFAGLESGETRSQEDPKFEGVILGIGLASVRDRDANGEVVDHFLCRPGDDVQISLPSAGTPPKFLHDTFTVVDLYESKMSEYDSTFAFVPIEKLQQLRGMLDPTSGIGAVNSIQLRLRPGANLAAMRDRLQARFPPHTFPYQIQTWMELQGPLLAAVQMETTLLNILLFLIIAVAGFGILATFFMIVVEKTKDIGILKSLGAPSRGVMSIFLGYGLSLGTVGAGGGMVLGLAFVAYINDIAALIQKVTGREVFDPTVYYFQRIPTIVQPWTIAWIVAGALAIAVMASILPALRAARLKPVEALRYE